MEQANTKVPQPDPEAIDTLDIPSPPAGATKQPVISFSLPKPPQPLSAVNSLPAQGKDLSYSEMDLRKPKRFASFSFVSRKKKKNDPVDISQNTIGLHGSGNAKQEEVTHASHGVVFKFTCGKSLLCHLLNVVSQLPIQL